MKFFKGITFKLTFWYALVLFVSSVLLLFTINFAYVRFVNQTVDDVLPPPLRQQLQEIEKGRQGNQRFRELLKEVRENDVRQVQRVSLILIAVNLLIATSGGYLLARQMLQPIKRVNTEMKNINENNLDKKIDDPDAEDEIAELIENFNSMTERLNKAFQAQGDFVANSAHELKTPLAILTTNLETASLSENISDDTKDYIDNAVETINNMNQLIEDLLLLSSINKNNFEFEKIDLGKLIVEIGNNLKSIASDKDIKLKTEVATNEAFMSGQRHLLERAISNIIENAIKYSPAGTTVAVKLNSLKDGYKISISDQGTGIPDKYKDRIFERFFRVDNSRSKKTGGSGLGLAISKDIIELHKGKITVASSTKKGTTFVINLPSSR